QLMGIQNFRPRIAVVTNLYEAHLDYHVTRENYLEAKQNIIKNQRENDYFIFNDDEEDCRVFARAGKSIPISFSTKRVVPHGAGVRNGIVYFQGEEILAVESSRLPGKHNLENSSAAISAAKRAGVSNVAIKQVLTTFSGVKHRLQFVKEIGGIKFYNDSKATNWQSTKVALAAFEQPIILLAGGLDRGDSFEELIPSLHNVKALIVF